MPLNLTFTRVTFTSPPRLSLEKSEERIRADLPAFRTSLKRAAELH